MDNNLNFQSGNSAFTYISQAQTAYSHYLQLRTELSTLESNLNSANRQFEIFPTQQSIFAVQEAWNRKLIVMQQIPQLVSDIAINLKEATKQAFASIQMSLATNNKVNIILSDNTLSSILLFLEQSPMKPYLPALYKQYCVNDNIPMQVSDIEIRVRLSRMTIPNFDRLKVIIRGY